MTDDLLLTCLVLVLLQEVGSTGKSDLIDVFLYFFCRHTKTVIDKGKGLVLRADDNLDLCLIVFREFVFSHHIQFL